MDNLFKMIQDLQATTKRTEKEDILKRYTNDEDIKYVLKFLYNPMVRTGLGKGKLDRDLKGYFIHSPLREPTLKMMIHYLGNNSTGRDADIFQVQAFLEQNPSHADTYRRILTKDLQLGIDTSTLNKVFGKGFIPTFDVMLAHSYDDYKLSQSNQHCFILTQKLDGLRCIAFHHKDGEVEFFSRNGHTYGEAPDIAEDIKQLPRGYVYDGELIKATSDEIATDDLFRATQSTARTEGTKRDLVFHVFDALPIEEFKSGISTTNCAGRKHMIETNITGLRWVKAVPILYQGSDIKAIDKFSNYANSQGWEGLMLNFADAPYECKRSRGILKVKQFTTWDLRCIGVFEGQNKLAGKLGGIIIAIHHDGKHYEVNCGSGFTDEQREFYWNNQHGIIGKIVEIQHFGMSQNQDGGRSLRFPVFMKVREDKYEPSQN